MTLSEAESKALLRTVGVPVAEELIALDASAAVAAAERLGYPVVVKLNGERIAHKTERGLVKLRLGSAAEVRAAVGELLAAARPDDGQVDLLVAPMIAGHRELIAGMVRDAQFGPCVLLGIGGVAAEALGDVQLCPAPLGTGDVEAMVAGLRGRRLLDEHRGEAAVRPDQLAAVLGGLGALALARPDVASVDLNPLIVTAEGSVIAVDALVELGEPAVRSAGAFQRPTEAQFRALFEPRAVLVAGASAHPGKFGFVALHNILTGGFPGAVYATNLEGGAVLDIETVGDIAELPAGEIDLVFVCTPPAANRKLLADCAARGVKAAFVTTAGYAEAGEGGRAAEAELVATAADLGILLAGPNGQGLVSTPAGLCAQIVAPYPPPGKIALTSQSGNLVSSWMNYARATGVGVSRAISAGNAAAVSPADYLEWFAHDEATAVSLAYIESVGDGRALIDRLAAVAALKPLVVLKGGTTEGGAKAAASHTGALAADDRVFAGAMRQAGVTRATSVEEAFEIAATFATQPLPKGPNTVILTTAGGWGVVTSDALVTDGRLRLIDLPDDLAAAIDAELPPRWSRSNPVDCAGGETRDTITAVLELLAAHPAVDAIVYLGLGIQSNEARLMRDGRFYPDHGLARIVDYHERQDERFAQAAAELAERYSTPILCATELAVADPDNPGPAAVRASGRMCYPSGPRAVNALGHLWDRVARFGR